MKSEIIERLGQTDILLPSLIADGLAANDRVKVRLSVLQSAGRHARDPLGVRFDLSDECRAAAIDTLAMETLVNGAGQLTGERITAPGLVNLEHAIWEDVAIMVRAVTAADTAEGDKNLRRLSALEAAVSPHAPDTLELAAIGRLTGVSGGEGDSLIEAIQSPRQREILDRMTSVMTLVEGHGDYVMDAVGPAVVPSVADIRAKFSARRGSAGRIEQAIRRVLGIDLKMKQYEQGSRFVKAVVDEAGMAAFNKVWTSPETLPTKDELQDPRLWLERVDGATPAASAAD